MLILITIIVRLVVGLKSTNSSFQSNATNLKRSVSEIRQPLLRVDSTNVDRNRSALGNLPNSRSSASGTPSKPMTRSATEMIIAVPDTPDSSTSKRVSTKTSQMTSLNRSSSVEENDQENQTQSDYNRSGKAVRQKIGEELKKRMNDDGTENEETDKGEDEEVNVGDSPIKSSSVRDIVFETPRKLKTRRRLF